MNIKLMKITPQIAEAFLAKNKDNRKLNQRRVELLSSSMMRGEWKTSPQPIVISKSGRLLDGQHRLSAIMHCGKSINMSVAENVNDDVFDVLDIGKNRTYSDITGLSKRDAAAITALSTFMTRAPTPQQCHKISEVYLDTVQSLTSSLKGNQKLLTSGSFVAGMAYMIHRFNCYDYSFNVYKNLIDRDYQNMNTSTLSFMRVHERVLLRTLFLSKSDIFSIACKLANPKKPNQKKYMFKNDDALNQFRAYTRSILNI